MLVRAHQAPEIRRCWRTVDHLEDPPLHLDRQVERFRTLLFDACRLRMRSDVPLATCLSGGLDSSAVHSVIARLNADDPELARRPSDWQTAFFAGAADDEERPFAEGVVRSAGTKGIYKSLDPEDALPHLDDIIFQIEEITQLPVSKWVLYRELRSQGMAVSLDGHGADELAAGYRHLPNYAIIEAVELLRSAKAASDGMGSEGVDPRLGPLLDALPEFPPHDPSLEATPVLEVLRAPPYAIEYPAWKEDARIA